VNHISRMGVHRRPEIQISAEIVETADFTDYTEIKFTGRACDSARFFCCRTNQPKFRQNYAFLLIDFIRNLDYYSLFLQVQKAENLLSSKGEIL